MAFTKESYYFHNESKVDNFGDLGKHSGYIRKGKCIHMDRITRDGLRLRNLTEP